MRLEKTYICGCHVMAYEIEMLPEFINSIIQAVNDVENKSNITCHFTLNTSQYFEQWESGIDISFFRNKFFIQIQRLIDIGISVNTSEHFDDSIPYTIAHYRRNLNYNSCEHYDFIIWGETDVLLPKETFMVIESVSKYAENNDINRYILTFAMRKMWSHDWSVLEHPKFTNEQYYDMYTESDRILATTKPHSIRYTMSQDEMEAINSESDDLEIQILTNPKFDGSALVISTDLIKAGVNIPHAVYLNGDDTAFLRMCQLIMGPKYRQFVIKNILKVHNRNHPKKRLYVKGQDSEQMTHFKRSTQSWYKQFNDISKTNLNELFHSQKRFASLDDFEKMRKTND